MDSEDYCAAWPSATFVEVADKEARGSCERRLLLFPKHRCRYSKLYDSVPEEISTRSDNSASLVSISRLKQALVAGSVGVAFDAVAINSRSAWSQSSSAEPP
jgi:hypothetical protein